ncbi:Methylated-DNA--(protein)-cysteine S-methyltransferase [Sulfurimonas denitrificans DSM 1251]|uniref:Methylated-DNA--protein-cysteine methyltransferase n=1 Tax=Sulfurimonas denitrificans (strain ATCC 33889 / DSM 1251) TaxID=326298 RepID=Q30SR8_SULDN|nr:methylated-DNA--[protein]-cysteine S-methyltransferase [Sulfurimonas denitrificans]ABB43963.1 Methylated-DNA--(protein)-cysteine S-methyltransferase [Sulfurimonas denitrificans DSM 1251]MDD3443249.1 methylated-DNA--[protein]-cysteine S-methyltransferase [Sulfurimonas denitrificans]
MIKDSRIVSTPIGYMLAVASESALLYLDFIDEKVETQNSNNPILLKLEQELRDYFVKKLRTFSIPLSPSGTAFQRAVWDTLLKIPYGLTLSYADEAKLFGNPKATRAVANANGKNPISILIPCHRVISSDGSIGGYSGGGIWRKEFLLSLEGVEK